MCRQIFIISCSNQKKILFLEVFWVASEAAASYHFSHHLFLKMHWSISTKKLPVTEPIYPDNSASHRLSQPCFRRLTSEKGKEFLCHFSWTGKLPWSLLTMKIPSTCKKQNCSSPKLDRLVFSLEIEYQRVLTSRKLDTTYIIWSENKRSNWQDNFRSCPVE